MCNLLSSTPGSDVMCLVITAVWCTVDLHKSGKLIIPESCVQQFCIRQIQTSAGKLFWYTTVSITPFMNVSCPVPELLFSNLNKILLSVSLLWPKLGMESHIDTIVFWTRLQWPLLKDLGCVSGNSLFLIDVQMVVSTDIKFMDSTSPDCIVRSELKSEQSSVLFIGCPSAFWAYLYFTNSVAVLSF